MIPMPLSDVTFDDLLGLIDGWVGVENPERDGRFILAHGGPYRFRGHPGDVRLRRTGEIPAAAGCFLATVSLAAEEPRSQHRRGGAWQASLSASATSRKRTGLWALQETYVGSAFVIYLGDRVLSFGPGKLALPLSMFWFYR